MQTTAIRKYGGGRSRLKRVLAVTGAAALLHLGAAGAGAYPPPNSLKQILSLGEIRVITGNSPHSYYVYRNQAMGFDYDLAREFAEFLGVRLRVVPRNTWAEMVTALYSGSGDIIAAGIEITPARARQVAFSNAYREVQQHLISRRGKAPITTIQELAGKTVDVSRGSADHERLEALRRQGLEVVIRAHDNVPVESLIRRAALGEIDFTLANSNVALLNRRYYPSASVQTLSDEHLALGWAVRPADGGLLEKINAFFGSMAESGRMEDIYEKYHWNIGDFDYLDLKTFHERIRTRLPRYRAFIKDAAVKNGFDWCLIAAQIYRESHLDPTARGAFGAQGLMQILPATGRSLKVTDPFDPVANIKAGVSYLKWLYDIYEGIEEGDRTLVALAAYNVGLGHVADAQRLAARMGMDPNRWDSLAKTLPLLRFRRYYQQAEMGYCRGDITVAYIKHILTYYDILKRQELDNAMAKAAVDTSAAFVD